MTPSQAGYAIHPSSPEATEIGLTPDRFGPGTSLWREGISLWFSHLEILGLHPRKVLHDLVARTNARGLIAVIPQDGETVDRELLEWGFVLQSFACKDGRRVRPISGGPRGYLWSTPNTRSSGCGWSLLTRGMIWGSRFGRKPPGRPSR